METCNDWFKKTKTTALQETLQPAHPANYLMFPVSQFAKSNLYQISSPFMITHNSECPSHQFIL